MCFTTIDFIQELYVDGFQDATMRIDGSNDLVSVHQVHCDTVPSYHALRARWHLSDGCFGLQADIGVGASANRHENRFMGYVKGARVDFRRKSRARESSLMCCW